MAEKIKPILGISSDQIMELDSLASLAGLDAVMKLDKECEGELLHNGGPARADKDPFTITAANIIASAVYPHIKSAFHFGRMDARIDTKRLLDCLISNSSSRCKVCEEPGPVDSDTNLCDKCQPPFDTAEEAQGV